MNREELKMKIGGASFRIVVARDVTSGLAGISRLEKRIREGENPVLALQNSTYGAFSTSRVPWDWSAKWVVNFI